MNQPCSKACCCWCGGTCVRYHLISAPAHPARGRSSSSSEPRVDTVRCRYASRFTWTIFSRLPFLEAFSGFSNCPSRNRLSLSPKSDCRGDFPSAFSLRILDRFERGLFCCILHIPMQGITMSFGTTEARRKIKRQKPQEEHVFPHLSVYKNVNLYSCAKKGKPSQRHVPV